MTSFEDHLAKVSGSSPKVDRTDAFARRQEVSTYRWNNATDLHSGALVAWAATGDAFPLTNSDLGLGTGENLKISMPPVFRLLAGLSLELALKAVARALDLPDSRSHNLNRLREAVGIHVTPEQSIILDNLTEAVIWASRYPTPKDRAAWDQANKAALKMRDKRALGPSSVYEYNPEKAVTLRTYSQLWRQFAGCYWRVKARVPDA